MRSEWEKEIKTFNKLGRIEPVLEKLFSQCGRGIIFKYLLFLPQGRMHISTLLLSGQNVFLKLFPPEETHTCIHIDIEHRLYVLILTVSYDSHLVVTLIFCSPLKDTGKDVVRDCFIRQGLHVSQGWSRSKQASNVNVMWGVSICF
jgi:hypothetical protein